jgi:hypothetical protein
MSVLPFWNLISIFLTGCFCPREHLLQNAASGRHLIVYQTGLRGARSRSCSSSRSSRHDGKDRKQAHQARDAGMYSRIPMSRRRRLQDERICKRDAQCANGSRFRRWGCRAQGELDPTLCMTRFHHSDSGREGRQYKYE